MITLKKAEQALANKEPFNAGNLTAEWDTRSSSLGTYVVRSYGVAIACIGYDPSWGWSPEIFSDAYKFSVTTSKHANMVKRAWDIQ